MTDHPSATGAATIKAARSPVQKDTYMVRAAAYFSYVWVLASYLLFNLAPSALPVETIQNILNSWGHEINTQQVIDGIVFYGTVFTFFLAVMGTKQISRVSSQPGVDNTTMIHVALAITVGFAIIFAISIFARIVIWIGVMDLSPWVFKELSSVVFAALTYVSYRTAMTAYEINSNTLKRTIDNSAGEL